MAGQVGHDLKVGTTVGSVDESTFRRVLEGTVAKISELIRNVKEQMADSGDAFITTAYGYLSPIIEIYAVTFAKLNVTSREELLGLFESHHKNDDIREIFEELVEAEDLWENTLKSFDDGLRKREGRTELTVGSLAPLDIPLTDLKTSRPLTLNDHVGKHNLLLVFLGHSA
ncbi:uncharacterized protein [Ptychodera flava]|uniref:uncharacterized protein n=1 Tax=Ptychodera flava TaxID=63121 RepID=UPI00396A1A5D